MARQSIPRAFTLVELLVVVSIIAILIGILVPALGQARRGARLAVDLSNLKQHGIATVAFAGDNKGRMPAPPAGRGIVTANDMSGESAFLGEPDRPAVRFAFKNFIEGPVNFRWGIDYPGAWKGYQFFMGDYVVDGVKDMGILNDVFVSPGAREIRRRWDEILRASAGGGVELLDFVSKDTGFVQNQREPYINKGDFIKYLNKPELDLDPGQLSVAMLQGSYRYTLVALVGSEEGNEARHFFGPGVQQGFGTGGAKDPFAGDPPENWVAFRAFNLLDRFQHPSGKVTFWEYFAANDREKERYWEDGVDTPVVMVDGSGRISKPARDMPPCDNGEVNEKLGGFSKLPDCLAEAASGGTARGSVHGRSAWFLHTNGGTRGRDF